jgi:hypothetical protein
MSVLIASVVWVIWLVMSLPRAERWASMRASTPCIDVSRYSREGMGRELFCIAVIASARVSCIGRESCCRALAMEELPAKLHLCG